VARSNGVFDVLVSSQGSDNLAVYSLGGAVSSGGVTPPPGGASLPTQSAFQPPAASPGALVVLTASATATSASASAASASTSASASSGALSATATSAVGLSLGGFSSLSSGSSRGNGDAVLVSVEGNTYLSVPILDFGAENDEVGNGGERMPWLSALLPVGDTSPLTRFILGLDEALRDYRGSEETSLPWKPASAHDPWGEDLFYRHLPSELRDLGPQKDGQKEGREPNAPRPDPRQNNGDLDRAAHARFGDKPWDDPGVPGRSPSSWIVTGLKVMAALLATALLLPAKPRSATRPKGQT
jgi:hypothetical protein